MGSSPGCRRRCVNSVAGLSGNAQLSRAVTGGHVATNGKTEMALSGDVAAKVKAAAQAKVSGGTVLRVETAGETMGGP